MMWEKISDFMYRYHSRVYGRRGQILCTNRATDYLVGGGIKFYVQIHLQIMIWEKDSDHVYRYSSRL